MKKTILFMAFLLMTMSDAMAQTANGGISADMLRQIEKSQTSTPADKVSPLLPSAQTLYAPFMTPLLRKRLSTSML